MNIDEQYLRTIINESVRRIVKEELGKYCLNEMAMPLSDYKKCVESRLFQILENWCLIRYATLSGDCNNLKNHWRVELMSHINYLANLKLKGKNSALSKEKCLYSVFNKYDLDTDESCIAGHIWTKFVTEGLPTDGEIFSQVVSDFKSSIRDIAGVILSNDRKQIFQYVQNI